MCHGILLDNGFDSHPIVSGKLLPQVFHTRNDHTWAIMLNTDEICEVIDNYHFDFQATISYKV